MDRENWKRNIVRVNWFHDFFSKIFHLSFCLQQFSMFINLMKLFRLPVIFFIFVFQMKSKLHYFSTYHKETKKRTMQPFLKALKKVQCFTKGQWMTFCFLMPLMGFYNVATLLQTLLYPQYKVIYEKAKKGLVLRQRLRGRRRSHNSLPLKKAWLKTLFTMKSRKSLLTALPENWRPTISTGRPKSIFGARK